MKNKQIRISKLISHYGYCSRKEAEKLISKGDVKINNQVFKKFFIYNNLIKSIRVKDKLLLKQKTRVWILNKPVGFVSSNKEQFKQKSLFRLLPENFPRVVTVGRLDINSDGLILLTNNPTLSNFLENPISNISRQYLVKVYGNVPENLENKLENQLVINGIIYKKVELKILTKKKNNNILKIELFEGKNREIRNILNHFNLTVKKLTRMSFGPFKLKQLNIGETSEIENLELKKKLISLKFNDENNIG